MNKKSKKYIINCETCKHCRPKSKVWVLRCRLLQEPTGICLNEGECEYQGEKLYDFNYSLWKPRKTEKGGDTE